MKTNKLYDERLQKVKDTITFNNSTVNNCYSGSAVPPKHMNITMADYIFKTDEGFKVFIDFINAINAISPIDSLNFGYPGMLPIGSGLSWFSKVKIPGRELDVNSLWQIEEKETMLEEDYDLLINNGYDALCNKLIPQIANMEDIDKFIKYHQESDEKEAQAFIDNGYPVLCSGAVTTPFDTLCGARSMSKFFMDCYKEPDKVKEAQDIIFESIKTDLLNQDVPDYVIGRWIGGWRGASAMVSPKIWDRFVWPYMYDCAMLLIERGITPILHLDQNWDRDIERFLELPEKKCIINTDGMTDLRNARKKLGDHIAFMGDVPAPLLSTGTPEQVEDYVKRLLDDIGIKGVFIAPGCDAPANSKYENIIALHKTVVEYK